MPTTDELLKRIQILEDVEAIKKLKSRWWFACDLRDLDVMRSCYLADDFLIDFGFLGQYRDMDKFLEMFGALACQPSHVDMHHGMAPEIDITGEDTAVGRWRMRFQKLESEKRMVQLMSGYYEDDYVKVGGEWKMKVSKYTLQSNLLMQADDNDALKILQIGSDPGLVTQE